MACGAVISQTYPTQQLPGSARVADNHAQQHILDSAQTRQQPEDLPIMAEPVPHLDEFESIPVAHLTTEDDEPVDNFFQDKQANLLKEALDASWPEGRPFVSAADVGIFATNQEKAVVPDVLLSVGVSFPSDILEKGHRSYFLWLFGKPPEW